MEVNTCQECNLHSLGGWCIYFDFKTKDSNPACMQFCPLETDEEMKK